METEGNEMGLGPEHAAVLHHITKVANEHLLLLNRPAWRAYFPAINGSEPTSVLLILQCGDRTETVTFDADRLWSFGTSEESRQQVLRALEQVVWELPK